MSYGSGIRLFGSIGMVIKQRGEQPQNWGSILGMGQRFFEYLGSTQSACQSVPEVFPTWINWPACESRHLLLFRFQNQECLELHLHYTVRALLNTGKSAYTGLYGDIRPRLWSSGQSSWLQIQRSGFDSRLYQIFWEVVGLERGPLSLLSTTEELLDRKVAVPV
jgi:hypothetical protein